jgi:cytochrome c oxidase subunit 4
MSDHSKSSPLKSYFSVWIALLVGTFLTYEVAKIDLGVFNSAVALIIATTKALLVALFFMHLKYEQRIMYGIAFAPFMLAAILFVLLFPDIVYGQFPTSTLQHVGP